MEPQIILIDLQDLYRLVVNQGQLELLVSHNRLSELLLINYHEFGIDSHLFLDVLDLNLINDAVVTNKVVKLVQWLILLHGPLSEAHYYFALIKARLNYASIVRQF